MKSKLSWQSPGAKLAAVAIAVLLGSTGAAQANVTIGSSLTAVGNSTGVDCGSANGDCVLALDSLFGGPMPSIQVVSPVNGTVVRWGVRVVAGAPYVRLRTLHLGTGSGVLHFTGSGVLHQSPAGGLDEFNESLPISVNSRIGVEEPGPGWIQVQTGPSGSPFDSSYTSYIASPDGSPAGAGTFAFRAELLLNAEIEPTNTFALGPPHKTAMSVTLPNPGIVSARSIPGLNGARHGLIAQSTSQQVLDTGGSFVFRLTRTKAARRALKVKGRARGRVAVTFTPQFGSPSTQDVTLTLKRDRKRK